MRDVIKVWKSLKIFGENMSASYYVHAYYKADSDSTWTEISGNFDTVPSEEIDIASTYPSKKRIKFKLRLVSKYNSDTPEVTAWLAETYGVVPVKFGYQIPILIKDMQEQQSLQGDKVHALGYAADSNTALAKLKSWAAAGTSLTMTSNVAALTDATVIVAPVQYQPHKIIDKTSAEEYFVNVVLHDI